MNQKELKATLHAAIAEHGARNVLNVLAVTCEEVATQSAFESPSNKSWLALLSLRLRTIANTSQEA